MSGMIRRRMCESTRLSATSLACLVVLMVGSGFFFIFEGCDGSSKRSETARHPQPHPKPPPHAGVPIALEEIPYALELLFHRPTGRLRLYVMDAGFRRFVRVEAHSLELLIWSGQEARRARLSAVANPATRETVGDTAMFEGEAEWLAGTEAFRGMLRQIEIRGITRTNVRFKYRGTGGG